MSSFIWIFFELGTVGLIAFISAYSLQKLKQIKGPFVSPSKDTILRLIIGKKVTRVRFDSEEGPNWILQNPIAKDEAPEIAAGIPVYGSFGSPYGVVRFRSTIVNLDPDGKIAILAPKQTLVQERRLEKRVKISLPALVERTDSSTIDLSPLGAKLSTPYRAGKGERVRVDLPELSNPIFGWVLEQSKSQIRVLFEDRIDLGQLNLGF